jgi:hypothetical protein
MNIQPNLGSDDVLWDAWRRQIRYESLVEALPVRGRLSRRHIEKLHDCIDSFLEEGSAASLVEPFAWEIPERQASLLFECLTAHWCGDLADAASTLAGRAPARSAGYLRRLEEPPVWQSYPHVENLVPAVATLDILHEFAGLLDQGRRRATWCETLLLWKHGLRKTAGAGRREVIDHFADFPDEQLAAILWLEASSPCKLMRRAVADALAHGATKESGRLAKVLAADEDVIVRRAADLALDSIYLSDDGARVCPRPVFERAWEVDGADGRVVLMILGEPGCEAPDCGSFAYFVINEARDSGAVRSIWGNAGQDLVMTEALEREVLGSVKSGDLSAIKRDAVMRRFDCGHPGGGAGRELFEWDVWKSAMAVATH